MSKDIDPYQMYQRVYFGLNYQWSYLSDARLLTSLRILEEGPHAEVGPNRGVRSSSIRRGNAPSLFPDIISTSRAFLESFDGIDDGEIER